MRQSLFFLAADAAVGGSGRTELIDGELHSVKEAAGVLLRGGTAFFVGDTEIISVYYHLYSSHHSDNREKSVGDIQGVAFVGIAETSDPFVDAIRDRTYIADTATAGFTYRHDLCG